MRLPLPARFLRSTVAVLLLAFAPAGCGDILGTEGGVVCPAIPVPAISVQVEHADTGNPIELALVTARLTGTLLDRRNAGSVDTAYAMLEQTREGDTVAVADLAHDVPGVYDATVEKDGFQQWRREDVQVPIGACSVQTVYLTARLEPS